MFSPFAVKSAPADYSGERLVNWFPRPADATTTAAMMGRSGLVNVASGLGGEVRAMASHGGVLYAVANAKLWKISGGTATEIGSVYADDYATMASDGSNLAIVTAGNYYVWDGSVFNRQTTGAVTAPTSVAWLSGYMLVTGTYGTRSDAIAASDLDDPKTFTALNFAVAEFNSDEVLRGVVDHSEYWLFGPESVEVWYLDGSSGFPLSRAPGATIDYGCKAGNTVASIDNTIMWVTPHNTVVRATGTAPQVVSTRDVEETHLIGATINGAFSFTDRGHQFYGIRRTGDTMICYDVTTGGWTERASGIEPTEWVCTSRAVVGGVEYFGTKDGTIVTQSASTYTDEGTAFTSLAVSAPVDKAGEYFRVSKFHLAMETGSVETTEPVEIMMQVSRDGKTWGAERWRTIAQQGQYNRRVVWHGLGNGRRFQVRLRMNEPASRDIYGAKYAAA